MKGKTYTSTFSLTIPGASDVHDMSFQLTFADFEEPYILAHKTFDPFLTFKFEI